MLSDYQADRPLMIWRAAHGTNSRAAERGAWSRRLNPSGTWSKLATAVAWTTEGTSTRLMA